jgi:hypothetical protein
MSSSLSPTNGRRRVRAGKPRIPIRRLAGFASAGVAALLLGSVPASAAARATPTMFTNASSNTTVGLQVFDHTNLSGAASPTGTITFKLFGPGDTTCQTSLFTATVPVSGTGSDNSPAFMTTVAGTYNWIATYNGDANNNPVAAPCGTASQAVTVGKAYNATAVTPTLVGTAIHGTAIVLGPFGSLTGTVTFTLTGPNDTFCSGPAVYTQTIPINGAGSYDSGSFTPTVAGTYTYRISYSGDANNYGSPISSCLTEGDSITITASQLAPPPASPPPPTSPPPTSPPPTSPPPTSPPPVNKATPTMFTNASSSTTVGLQVFDHTNLSGAASPTGTITFKLFGPGDTTCQTSLFTATVPVSGTGSDNSPAFMTTVAGTYNWIATYNGDANNNPVAAPCGTASQAVTVGTMTPVMSVTPTLAGTAIHGTAVLQGGFGSPTGTVTFTLTGPNDVFCSRAAVYTQTIPVDGAGSYNSGSFTPTVAGTYNYRVTYSGDANDSYVPISSCLAQGDSITITQSQLAPV